MKIVGLEEHFVTPSILAAWKALPAEYKDLALKNSTEGEVEPRLLDLSQKRFEAMKDAGVDIQVLSLTTPGVQNLERSDAVALQVELNDALAATVRANPDKLQGFATLATPDPKAAAGELERVIKKLGLHGAMLFGRTRERNMDHRDFWPIYEVAASLRAPIYVHPQTPVAPVRKAYYEGYGDEMDSLFSRPGIGWHYETGVQLLRLILSGVFDEFPDLQIITGHWGEVVLFYLERIDLLSKKSGLKLPISEYFRRNISVTPSGTFSQRYLRWAIEVIGVERILFSTDYPYAMAPNGGARAFLEKAELSQTDREKIAFGNWERLCGAIRRG